MKTKNDIFLDYLKTGESVLVQLDGLKWGCILPKKHKRNHVVLEFGHRLPVPVLDLRSDEIGLAAILSFDHAPFTVYVPWDAVFAMTCGVSGEVFTAAMPAVVANKLVDVVAQTRVEEAAKVVNLADWKAKRRR